MFVEVPSEIRYIRKVSSEIMDALTPFKISQDDLFDIRLCTEEAVRNAIVHGNNSNKKLHVKVNYSITDDKVTIEVEDEGPGFDPEKIPDPRGGGNIMKESGRGVCLIKELMDRVEYNKKGNKIVMEKFLG